jgi:hypothetical protein
MAKKQKEAVAEETTEKLKVKQTKVKSTENKKEEVDTKVKIKKNPLNLEETITKVDLSKPAETKTVEKQENVNAEKQEEVKEEKQPVVEEVVEEAKVEEKTEEPQVEAQPVIEEVTEEEQKEVEEVTEEIEEAVAEAEATGKPVPEKIQKLMDFMEETGGDLQDYVKLNRDYSKDSDMDVLQEYYKQTKPHLTSEEVDFLMEDKFSFDKDADDEKDIKRKKLALKEQVADARSHLDGQKSKYYEEIKSGTKLTTEQQKAIDFFNRYNKESEETKKITEANKNTFLKKTDQVFNNKFKGFEYNVGDKKYRFNVKNVNEVKETQSDINNFVKKFLNKDNTIEDAKGYHKSLFTATNADAIANHFYEQGKADALKESIAKSKNINTDARGSHTTVNTGGIKVRVLGEDSNDFKFKIKNKN